MNRSPCPDSEATRIRPRGKRRARRLLRRRMAGLALAIAVPAMAAPHVEQQERPATIVIPFALIENRAPAAEAIADAVAPVTAETAPSLDPGPAAQSLRITGSAMDQLRAEQCMAMAIYYEAASESEDGKRAVAQVVINRVRHPHFPANVCGVVYQGSERSTGCQFSFTCDGSLDRRPDTIGWAQSLRIAREALGGAVYAPVGLATHYHTRAVRPYWAATLTQVGTIGAHLFYRWRGSSGEARAFTASYGGAEPLPVRELASAQYRAQPLGHAPALPATQLAPTPAANAGGETTLLPAGGEIRAEFANSGQWLARP